MISDGIVKVDSFLNHRLETGLLFDMGAELARRFSKDRPDLVLTVEASGIALAMTTAHALGDIPVVFAKKGKKWDRRLPGSVMPCLSRARGRCSTPGP